MRYSESPFFYHRRKTREVVIGDPAHGGVIIGGNHPVVMQSMLTCDTMDTAECVRQTLELVAVGCQLVRITAPTVRDAANLQNIVRELRAQNCLVPIVADIHFKPEAAMEAVKWVEVVRVNPGNYADSKKFAAKEYTDAQYAAELKRIGEKFAPLRRYAAGHGRERAGIRPHLPPARLPHLQVLDEVVQPEGDDRMLPPARGPAGTGRARLELSDSPRRDRGGRGRGWPHQKRHRHRFAAV
jgi:hypothetical protein